MNQREYNKPSDQELREKLTPLAYQVTQLDATEPPFHNAFWNHKEPGLYVDVTTGEPLFHSADKFDSGTGWPSFTRPVTPEVVVTRRDLSHGMVRVEARSRSGDAHLGHVFEDGPAPTGLRYCINSAALRFIPEAELEQAGYGAFSQRAGESVQAKEATACVTPEAGAAPGCQTSLETAYLAGGCFWGMEEILRTIPGVLETEVGYTGGNTESPTYEQVSSGQTGHAETVRVVFDPQQLSYAELLEKWFFRMHDPTTPNQQGNDRGTQYRSALFVTSEEQKKTALEVIARVNASGKWKAPLVTEVVQAKPFTRAEEYHQKYLLHRPNGYTCHYLRDE